MDPNNLGKAPRTHQLQPPNHDLAPNIFPQRFLCTFQRCIDQRYQGKRVPRRGGNYQVIIRARKVNNKLSYRKQNAFNVIKTRERNTCSEFNTIFNKMLDLDFFKIARFCTLVGHNYPCTRNWRVFRFANTLFVIITVSPHRKAGSWRCPPVCLFVA